MTEEDEAFNELEKKLNKPIRRDEDDDIMVYRNELLEEVAAHLEQKFKFPFGQDTVASFAAYIRGMKR